MKKGITLIIVVVFVSAFYLGIVAAPNLQEVKVNIDYGMKMFLHGQSFNPTDVSTGTAYRPIIYKNKIYLPARDICEAANLAIDYNGTENILSIGDKLDYVEVKAEDFQKWFYTSYTKDPGLLFTPNKTYKYGIVKTPTNWDMYGAVINPKGRYNKFKTALYLGEGESKSITFEFVNSVNNELLKSVTLEAGKTVDVEFDIVGVDSFRISHQGFHDDHRIILGEPQFK